MSNIMKGVVTKKRSFNHPACKLDTLFLTSHASKLGPDALAVCQAHQGLPAGFLLLRYSVLFTVESLSLLYLLVIS